MPMKPQSHRPHGSAKAPDDRPSACKRGYGRAHRRARAAGIRGEPCVECLKEGRVEPAVVRDHIIPHRGDLVLLNDPNNIQWLCLSCHGRKSAKERMGK